MRYLIPIFTVAIALSGCQSPANNAGGGPGNPSVSATSTNTAASTDRPGEANRGGVAAIIDGQTVSHAQLRPLLVEAVGGEVLAELVLDRKIDAALKQAGLAVGAGDMQAEKRKLMRRLSDDRDRATKMLAELRQRRGLGDRRFNMLLKRNAGLRKLVADEVQVTEAMVREQYLIAFGPRYSARMILCPNLVDANRALKRVRAGEDFIAVAIDMSTDRSKNQGGLLPDISQYDTTFPAAIRQTVAGLENPGAISEPVALDGGFAILKLEGVIPGNEANWDQVKDAYTEAVTLRAQAAAMQRRVRVMLESASVTVLDSDLGDSWKQQRNSVLGDQ